MNSAARLRTQSTAGAKVAGQAYMSPRTAARACYLGEKVPPWVLTQKKVFSNWCNQKLKDRSIHIENLFVDLADGISLYNLLEIISKQSLVSLGKISKKPRMDIQKIANLNICFKYLR
jgi:hypothetical protein